ncbi:2-hydroxyisoflavanone dehydratase [Thalictrum thalictroides]|uniref:2-hydroxyisoflavanone dehydratase n=1 Tax=Thalictrum thalictroides TaxID=46969 RepID=A0A7J6VI31_THATH|nr:2-hydroxyisoflavanone dehydratase [Thalictrum thalictroides]
MDSSKVDEVIFEFPPFLRVYKDGRKERIQNSEFIPPSSIDPTTGVSSKDVVIDPKSGLSARLYLPKLKQPQTNKLPLLIYFHGGGFCIETAFTAAYHFYLNSLVAEANVVAISVDYRRAPEHPLPIAYEDSWTSLQWLVSQSKEEEWFKNYVDFNRVFMAGDSAGANIAHNMAIRAGYMDLNGLKINGIILIHPYFVGNEPIGSEVGNVTMDMAKKLWTFVCPLTTGMDDPLINPVKDPHFSRLGCKRVLVCVAEKDGLRDRGKFYHEELGKSEWDGVVEFMEAEGENHVFHLFNPSCKKAVDLMSSVVSFIHTSE